MPNRGTVCGYLRAITAVAVLGALSPATAGEGEPSPAEKELKRVVGELPKCAEKAELPRILTEMPAKGDEENYGKVRVARMTSDTTAKITISYYTVFDKGRVEEPFTVFFYLSWYKGAWTVTKYEGDIPFPTLSYGHPLRKFIANLDDLGGKK